MPNLGEMLRKQNEIREAAKVSEEQEKTEAEARKFKREHEEVKLFFVVAQDTIESAIRNNKPVKPIKITHRDNGFEIFKWNDRYNITSPRHPHNIVFVEFRHWLEDNGLTYRLVYEHDGMGMDGWYLIRIEPKEG